MRASRRAVRARGNRLHGRWIVENSSHAVKYRCTRHRPPPISRTGDGEPIVEGNETLDGTSGAAAVCRAALERGPLIRDSRHWRFGRRLFSNVTVTQLIAEGWAVRDGRTIRRVG